MMLTGVDYSPA